MGKVILAKSNIETSVEIKNKGLHRTRRNNFKICMETQISRIAKTILRKRTELEESHSLTSDYTTKLQ